ncbi:MAG: GNAT family N-acetyltransferase [Planctomycetota bacterium]|jgi:putative acetyltransferase
MIKFRQEEPGDHHAIRRVNEQGFGTSEEANLVDALRQANAIVLSMVALDGEDIIAHILFTEVVVTQADSQFTGLGLGPMAVLPCHQRKGIGTQLLQIALDKCCRLDYDFVVVMGYPEFYSKFGFSPAKPYSISCEFDAPDEAFMVLELRKNALAGRSGIAHYRDEFQNA